MDGRRKIKLVIAYGGTDYHGGQIQPGYRANAGVRRGTLI